MSSAVPSVPPVIGVGRVHRRLVVTRAVLCGTDVGVAFRAGVAAAQRTARAEEWAGLNAPVLLATHGGLTVPPVSVGALADTVGPRPAALAVAILLAAAALATNVAERRHR